MQALKNKNVWVNLLLGVLLLYCGALILHIAMHPEQFQWDLRVYNYAANAFDQGYDPYGEEVFSQTVPQPSYRYVYPPLTIQFFRIFSLFDFDLAYQLYLAFKCLLLGGLIYIWILILGTKKDVLFYLFCLLAFNSALYIDLIAGNISIIEQFLLWLAFYAFIHEKMRWFCLLTILAAFFKLTFILFLFILLFSNNKKKYLYIGGSFLLFFAVQFIPYLNNPAHFNSFWNNMIYLQNFNQMERGITAPSVYPLIKHALGYLSKLLGFPKVGYLNEILYLMFAIPIFLLGWLSLARLQSLKIADRNKIIVAFACLTYALVIPRLKDYSYILLILPTYFWFHRSQLRNARPFIFIVLTFSTLHLTPPGINMIYTTLWNYYPLFLTIIVWAYFWYDIQKMNNVTHESRI